MLFIKLSVILIIWQIKNNQEIENDSACLVEQLGTLQLKTCPIKSGARLAAKGLPILSQKVFAPPSSGKKVNFHNIVVIYRPLSGITRKVFAKLCHSFANTS